MRRFVRVLLLVVSIVVVITTSGLTFSYETATYSAEVGEASSAEIKLDLADQATRIRAAAGSHTLIRSQLDYVGEVEFSADGGRRASIHLKVNTHNKVYAGVASLAWSVDLSPALPLSLIVDGGAGDLDADLSELELVSLDVELDSGDSWITLPAGDERLPLRLAAGSGDVVVRIPAGRALEFSPLQIGRGDVLFEIGEDVDFQTTVELNAGRLILDVPDGAAVRVHIESVQRGTFKRELRLAKARAGWTRDSGIWQTETFDDQAPRIDLTVRLNRGELIVR